MILLGTPEFPAGTIGIADEFIESLPRKDLQYSRKRYLTPENSHSPGGRGMGFKSGEIMSLGSVVA